MPTVPTLPFLAPWITLASLGGLALWVGPQSRNRLVRWVLVLGGAAAMVLALRQVLGGWAMALAAGLALGLLRAPWGGEAPAPSQEALMRGKLRESEQHLGSLVEQVREYAVYQLDPEGRITTWNPGAERVMGGRADQVIGRNFAQFYPEEQVRANQPAQDLALAGRTGSCHARNWRVRLDGSRFMADQVLTANRDPEGRLIGFTRGGHDLSERMEAEARLQAQARDLEAQMAVRTAALQESEARLQGLIRHAPAAIAVKGLDGRLLLVNRKAEAMIGLCAAVTPEGSREQLFPPWHVAKARAQEDRVVTHREELALEETLTLGDGTARDYLIQEFPLQDGAGHCWGLGLIATNITERKQAEEAHLQNQKLASLSQLAGGIAHDFNNLLGAMLGNVELARLELGPLEHLQTLEGLITRATGRVAQILVYAGMGKFQAQVLDLNHQVEETLRILRTPLSRKAVMRWEPGAGLPPMEGDMAQIQQVIINLIMNACEALDPMGGVITIRSGEEFLTQAALDRQYRGQALEPGAHLVLEIADNGPGMSAEVKERMFDPFFTTKFTGRGLGLSAVQGILRSHRGGVRVLSEEGRGTTFSLLFPVVGEAGELHAEEGEGSAGAYVGSGTVLVVDDEEAVRAVVARAMRRMGFEVLEAGDGLEALAVFEGHWDRIRLILMDLTMPGMGGEEACRELRRSGAVAPVILSSGFGQEEALQRFKDMSLAGFLQKPYRLRALQHSVRRALEGPDGSAKLRGSPPREMVEWVPEFQTGVGPLDAQHKGLLRAFNRLVVATEEGGPASEKALSQLIDALAAHVRSEGEPAGGGGKPQTGLRQTLERLHALLLQLRRGQGSLAPGEFNSLEDALLNHIQLECRGRT